MFRKLFIAFGLALLTSVPSSFFVSAAGAQTAKTTVGPVPISSSQAVGTPLNSCRDLTASGSYYLSQNVSSPGVCFGIDASNISLNLNGHTITYGTGGGTTGTPAIEAHDCWANAPDGPCGERHGGLQVFNGTIVQSTKAAPFSHVFYFGESNGLSPAPKIYDITTGFSSTGSMFYYSSYTPTGAQITHNLIYDQVKNIQQPAQDAEGARSHFQGEAIFIDGQENNSTKSGDYIAYNKIVGSPQGGIRTVNQYSLIEDNDISQNATYSNDYCVEVSADHTTVQSNYCHPTSGRGVNVDASYVTVSGNHITTIELPQNTEYGGCELGGSYDVRVEAMSVGGATPNPVGVVIKNNLLVDNAGACDARAVRFVYLTNQAKVSVTGNTIQTTNSNHGAQDFAISLDDTAAAGVTITGNTITSHTAWGNTDWDGGNSLVIGHNTWEGSPEYTWLAGDGECDPSVGAASPAACPVNATLTDSLPSAVRCTSYSEARINIDGRVTQCRGQ